MPSLLASPVVPHYRPSTNSRDSELSGRSILIQNKESFTNLSANNEDNNRNNEGVTFDKLFDVIYFVSLFLDYLNLGLVY